MFLLPETLSALTDVRLLQFIVIDDLNESSLAKMYIMYKEVLIILTDKGTPHKQTNKQTLTIFYLTFLPGFSTLEVFLNQK